MLGEVQSFSSRGMPSQSEKKLLTAEVTEKQLPWLITAYLSRWQ